jgi:hypothetical protein
MLPGVLHVRIWNIPHLSHPLPLSRTPCFAKVKRTQICSGVPAERRYCFSCHLPHHHLLLVTIMLHLLVAVMMSHKMLIIKVLRNNINVRIRSRHVLRLVELALRTF